MMQFFFNTDNVVFTVAIGLMLAIAFLEIVSSLFGFAMSHFLDGMINMHILHMGDVLQGDAVHACDAVHAADVLHSNNDMPLFTRFIGWIRFGQVPLLIVMIAFLTIFSSIGLLEQNIFKTITKHYLPWFIAILPALFLSLPLVRGISMILGKICIKDETSAVNSATFVGKIAEITIGVATKSAPAEAKLKDEFNQTHYIMVVPENDADVYPAQTKVKVTSQQQDYLFTVVKL